MKNLSLGNTAEMLSLNMEAIEANSTFSMLLDHLITCHEVKEMPDENVVALNLEILSMIDEVGDQRRHTLTLAVETSDALQIAHASRDFFVKQLEDVKKIVH